MEITFYQITLGTTLIVAILMYARLLILRSFNESKLIYSLFLIQITALSVIAGYNFNPDWHITLEFTKIFLNWPAVSGIVALTLIYKFQNGIAAWFAKISLMKGTLFGQPFEVLMQQNTPQVNDPSLDQPSNNSATNATQNGSTDADFSELPQELKDLPDIHTRIEYARNNPIRYMIGYWEATWNLYFERQYKLIFGSQLGLLNFMSLNPEVWHTFEQIKGISYQLYIVKGGTPEYTFEKFMGYMKEAGFVEVKNENNIESAKMTSVGKRFIEYVKTQYPNEWSIKPF